MKKLKLEELEVVSFETAPAMAGERGTVHGAAKPTRDNCTYALGCDSHTCPTTPDMDCTYGCTRYNCETGICPITRLELECPILTEAGCAPVTDLDCTIVP